MFSHMPTVHDRYFDGEEAKSIFLKTCYSHLSDSQIQCQFYNSTIAAWAYLNAACPWMMTAPELAHQLHGGSEPC